MDWQAEVWEMCLASRHLCRETADLIEESRRLRDSSRSLREYSRHLRMWSPSSRNANRTPAPQARSAEAQRTGSGTLSSMTASRLGVARIVACRTRSGSRASIASP